MVKFILKRLLFYIISVPILIFIILYLANASIVDSVDRIMNLGEYVPSKEMYRKLYDQSAQKHHLNLPLFYGTIKSNNYSKDFFKIKEKKYRKLAEYFLENGARYVDVDSFLNQIRQVELDLDKKKLVQQSTFNKIFFKKEYLNILLHLEEVSDTHSLMNAYRRLLLNSSVSNKLLPTFLLHGAKNQFHQYVSRLLRGDLGLSYVDNQPVQKKLFRALQYTLIFVLMGVTLAIPASIWWGKISTIYSQKTSIVIIQLLSYAFFAMPMFLLCTLLLVFFTTDEYIGFGSYLTVPKAYLFNDEISPLKNILLLSGAFVLPIIAVFLHNFAVFGRQVKTLLNGELDQPYLLTAKMKGLPNSKIISKHAYGNIRIQMITIFSGAITGLFGGSVVIEYIFNIPGMGRLTYESVRSGDIPMLMAIVLVTFTVTTVLYAISDYFYRIYNPKVRLS